MNSRPFVVLLGLVPFVAAPLACSSGDTDTPGVASSSGSTSSSSSSGAASSSGDTSSSSSSGGSSSGGSSSGQPVYRWEIKQAMPTDRVDLAAAFSNGRLYVLGGFSESRGLLGEVEAYDPATDTWYATSALRFPRDSAGAAVDRDGKIYLIGGRVQAEGDVTDTGRVDVFDPNTRRWSVGFPLPSPRRFPSVVSDSDGTLYVYGGVGADEATSRLVYALAPGANTWATRSEPLSRPRVGSGALGDDLLFVVDAEGQQLTGESWTLGDAAWSAVPPFPGARQRHATGFLGGQFHVLGGRADDQPLTTHAMYDPQLRTWSSGPPLPEGRHSFAVTTDPSGALYVLGGSSAARTSTRTVWALTAH